MYTCICVLERFLIGIGSSNYGDQKVPCSAVCKLETQENWGVIQSKSKYMKTTGAHIQVLEQMHISSSRESVFSLPPPFSSNQALNGLGDAHPHL